MNNKQLKLILKSYIINEIKSIISLINYKKFSLTKKKYNKKRKVAILCYLGNQYIPNHTNYEQQGIIIKILESFEYDVICIENSRYIFDLPKPNLIIGFGNSWRLLINKYPNVKNILYATEAPPFMSYINESLRVMNSIKKGYKRSKIQRSYKYYYDDDYINAKDIFQMGEYNCSILNKLNMLNKRVTPITSFGIGYLNKRDKQKINRSFLWFGSHGVVHKGLDITIKAFSNLTNITLYVAGCKLEEFKNLNPTKNIKYLGYINPENAVFEKITEECIGFILPSASEGMSTAALTCMYKGLIPIVTKETNISAPYSYIINPNIVDIISSIEKIISMSDLNLKKISDEILRYSTEKFTPLNYEENIKKALMEVL